MAEQLTALAPSKLGPRRAIGENGARSKGSFLARKRPAAVTLSSGGQAHYGTGVSRALDARNWLGP
jgi:hypothetical protein